MSEKPPLHLLLQLPEFNKLLTTAFYNGGQRPGRRVLGFLQDGEKKEKVVGGLLRHLTALENGERINAEGEDNLANVAACVVMYVMLTERGLWK